MKTALKGARQKGFRVFGKRLLRLFHNPVFLTLTAVGNSVILFGTVSLYWIEFPGNPTIKTMLDTLWWSVSTVTTVGYGDVNPITPLGRVVGIFMMIIGTALFWSFTALFAEALLTEDILDAEAEMHSLEKRIRILLRREDLEAEQLNRLTTVLTHLSKNT